MKLRALRLAAVLSLSLTLPLAAQTRASDARDNAQGPFQVSSTTFQNNSVLPISMIDNITANGVNSCSIDGSAGGDQSPQLSWTNAPSGTASFVVILYDETASFTHWGMYNIGPSATGMPENAGVKGSTFGQQVVNDFGAAAEYDGPCPPANVKPFVHHYVFTVYALSTELHLGGSKDFPPNAERLFHVLINAGRYHQILASAKIVGLYSTTPSN
jgi:Raf kinase inhibitor-like YbhB/YbcL family protein